MKTIQKFICLFIAISITTSIYAQTEIEPNDNFSQAQTVATGTIQASINPDYDKDYFKITIPRAGVLTVDVTNVGSNIPLYVGLYDQNQNLLDATWASSGGNISFEELVNSAGIYYFQFRSNSTSSSARSNPQLHNITFGLDTSDVYEWNNDFASATEMSYDTTIQGQIRSRGDEDFYKVTIPKSGVLTASINNVGSNIPLYLGLYDQNQNLLDATWASSGGNISFEELVNSAGIYYFKIRSNSTSSSASSNPQLHNITFGLDTSDVYEWNNDFNNAATIPHQGTFQAQIRSTGDVDYFEFTPPLSGQFTANIFNVASNMSLRMYLYDDNQNFIKSASGSSGGNVNLQQTITACHTYYLKIEEIGNNASNSQLFTLNLNLDTTAANNDYTYINLTSCNPANVSTVNQVYSNYNGCDSVVVTTTSLLPSNITNLSALTCDQNQVGLFTQILTNQYGCDSTVNTTYTLYSTSTNLAINICQGQTYTVGTSTYTTSGTYTDILQTWQGCDSTITLNLIVNPTQTTTLNQTICDNQSFSVGTSTYTTSGTYTDVLQTWQGCDSTVTLNLIVNPTQTTTLNQTICDNQSYTVGNSTYTTSGTFTDVLQTWQGCDSTVTLNLIVNPTQTTTLNQTICDNQSFTVGTSTYTTSGTFTDILQTWQGCDSTVILDLVVLPEITIIDTIITDGVDVP
ncbi:MAG: pre-peptidase C-terminal domain-containing protein, partial [Saprospiraceae bacterium]